MAAAIVYFGTIVAGFAVLAMSVRRSRTGASTTPERLSVEPV